MVGLDGIKKGLENLPKVEHIDLLMKEGKYKSHEQIAEAMTNHLNDFAKYIYHHEDKEHSQLEIITQSGIVNILKEKGYEVIIDEENGDYSIGVDW